MVQMLRGRAWSNALTICVSFNSDIPGSERALKLNDLHSFHLEEAVSRHPPSPCAAWTAGCGSGLPSIELLQLYLCRSCPFYGNAV